MDVPQIRKAVRTACRDPVSLRASLRELADIYMKQPVGTPQLDMFPGIFPQIHVSVLEASIAADGAKGSTYPLTTMFFELFMQLNSLEGSPLREEFFRTAFEAFLRTVPAVYMDPVNGKYYYDMGHAHVAQYPEDFPPVTPAVDAASVASAFEVTLMRAELEAAKAKAAAELEAAKAKAAVELEAAKAKAASDMEMERVRFAREKFAAEAEAARKADAEKAAAKLAAEAEAAKAVAKMAAEAEDAKRAAEAEAAKRAAEADATRIAAEAAREQRAAEERAAIAEVERAKEERRAAEIAEAEALEREVHQAKIDKLKAEKAKLEAETDAILESIDKPVVKKPRAVSLKAAAKPTAAGKKTAVKRAAETEVPEGARRSTRARAT